MDGIESRGPSGFLSQSFLPSPSPSTSSNSLGIHNLPHPRSKTLQPGSNKADIVRRYAEERLLYISRRYVKKFGDQRRGEDIEGYKTFAEVCNDFDAVVNVLWLSGTPSLQIPFLLKVASDYTQYVRSFPLTLKPALLLLAKLDHCFSSLLLGHDIRSGEKLPGFENGPRAGMTTTDMVRCRSLVEQTRVLMVEILGNNTSEEINTDHGQDDVDEDGKADDTTDSDTIMRMSDVEGSVTAPFSSWVDEDEEMYLDTVRIYENTIVHLGERLGEPLNGPGPSNDVTCA